MSRLGASKEWAPPDLRIVLPGITLFWCWYLFCLFYLSSLLNDEFIRDQLNPEINN